MQRAKKGQQKVHILKKTKRLCWPVLLLVYYLLLFLPLFILTPSPFLPFSSPSPLPLSYPSTSPSSTLFYPPPVPLPACFTAPSSHGQDHKEKDKRDRKKCFDVRKLLLEDKDARGMFAALQESGTRGACASGHNYVRDT